MIPFTVNIPIDALSSFFLGTKVALLLLPTCVDAACLPCQKENYWARAIVLSSFLLRELGLLTGICEKGRGALGKPR